mmetsp:Transcript_11397/g.26449  ORF Transcript_11397/g.26449 Transcript_11397/m.26449 type:complete len:112 (+) Transcript_11397:118-453(+)
MRFRAARVAPTCHHYTLCMAIHNATGLWESEDPSRVDLWSLCGLGTARSGPPCLSSNNVYALDTNFLEWLVVLIGSHLFDCGTYVHSLNDTSKNGVLVVQPRSGNRGDEKL